MRRDSIALQVECFYLLRKGWFHTNCAPEEGCKVAPLEKRWLRVTTKLNIKEAIRRTSLYKKMVMFIILGTCDENLIAISFFLLNLCFFGIIRGARAPQNKKK